MPTALESRLAQFLSTEPATRVMDGSARWPNGFGGVMDTYRSVVVHLTAGWPPREKVEVFVTRYIGPPAANVRSLAGYGTQYFIVGDGTVFRIIDMPRVTWHGNHVNDWAIGVETGNLGNVAPPPGNRWRALGPGADQNAADVPGAKLWISQHGFDEVLVSWWTTRTYAGPARAPVGNRRFMLFTESQYRSWALLARYLCERWEIPRNFPLLPHALRSGTIDDSGPFRRIALADERFPVIVRGLAGHNIQEALFEAGNAATLEQRYDAAIQPRNPPNARRNPIWTGLFDVFRGLHGHGFSGSNRLKRKENPPGSGNFVWVGTDHDCPGPLFDWHRFARETWDWWWYPFDFRNDTDLEPGPRPYRRAAGNTPLHEYYFDARDASYVTRQENGARGSHGIFDATSSPSTFLLDRGVSVYAPANGQLVAARFPDTGDQVSLAFVLIRHEIFHRPNTLTMEIEGEGVFPVSPGRIDYDLEPSWVYSLVIHLGRPEGMSFEDVTEANPDWLNRLLVRLKECELGIAFYDGDPQHGGILQAAWDSEPPGTAFRPTVLAGWRLDQATLGPFLETLAAGRVAILPNLVQGVTPVRVILGDFLGESGVIRREGGVVQHGVGLEVFGSGFVPPSFQSFMSTAGWTLPAGAITPPPPAIFYQSEWARSPDSAERQRLAGIGVDPDLVPWWPVAAVATMLDPTLPGPARLNPGGWAFHYRPLDFMRWINGVTWASEWPKYEVTDAHGATVPMAPDHLRPRSRRV